jgi:hypothetical protein
MLVLVTFTIRTISGGCLRQLRICPNAGTVEIKVVKKARNFLRLII